MSQPEEELGIDAADYHDAGMHEEPDQAVEDWDENFPKDAVRTEAVVGVEDLVTSFVELFNARDEVELQTLLADGAELPDLGEDPDGFPGALEDLWDRNPTVTATTGWRDEEPLVVLWVRNDGAWWRTGRIVVEGDEDGIAVAELVESPPGADGVITDEPERNVEEGADWDEWENGVLD